MEREKRTKNHEDVKVVKLIAFTTQTAWWLHSAIKIFLGAPNPLVFLMAFGAFLVLWLKEAFRLTAEFSKLDLDVQRDLRRK